MLTRGLYAPGTVCWIRSDMKRGAMTAAEMGKRGGKARARNMTPEQLSQAGKHAIAARWAKRPRYVKPRKGTA